MSKQSDERGVGDWPAISENHWYTLAITSAIFTALAVLCSFLWIFADGFDPEKDVKSAQVLAPFGVALFALVTFCTAGWRGSINTRQANQSENEGRAKLLQEGAKLLADVEKPAHVSAGIATLGVLISGPDKGYAFQGMSLLADFVEDRMSENHSNRHRSQISGAMRSGEQNGVNTGREISFDCTNYDPDNHYDDDYVTYWNFIPGFASIQYKSGIFDYDIHYEIDNLDNVNFNNVEIRGWRPVNVDDRFYRCSFSNCDIGSVSSLIALRNHKEFEFSFENCDFSGCIIHVRELVEIGLKKQHNYYLRGRPPILLGFDEPIDWSKILLCEETKPDRHFLL
ncbi:hypothetical protein IMCC20628_02748 [Hoeflea sp. IMCC20628]|uniref:hypothetical protein n=1 Tax=Hoeflea sp. IMCC20628 TaxID=1620421 RepID=UPI00063B0553|nr:hypothetical protein [Hoeflea sp. IMCC20628]AKI01444.1 hypothetical protein IMCC20628_02748 [Hoeflea sp. IMCC20628]